MKTAIVGGGAAGFFLAINLKEMCPQMYVTIFEKSKKVLAKVEVSGGGRCNCTNSFDAVTDLSQVYPRGHRLLKRLFKTFDYRDAYQWFESHGVRLTTQDDNCVFPMSQDSHTIINLFLAEARRHGIEVRTQCKIESLEQLADYDFKVITTGGGTASMAGVPIVDAVPSLFTFSIADEALRGPEHIERKALLVHCGPHGVELGTKVISGTSAHIQLAAVIRLGVGGDGDRIGREIV